jgi:hypothetical protein
MNNLEQVLTSTNLLFGAIGLSFLTLIFFVMKNLITKALDNFNVAQTQRMTYIEKKISKIDSIQLSIQNIEKTLLIQEKQNEVENEKIKSDIELLKQTQINHKEDIQELKTDIKSIYSTLDTIPKRKNDV